MTAPFSAHPPDTVLRGRPSQPFLVTVAAVLAGGDSVVRDAAVALLALAGLHVPVPNCYVGSGPGC